MSTRHLTTAPQSSPPQIWAGKPGLLTPKQGGRSRSFQGLRSLRPRLLKGMTLPIDRFRLCPAISLPGRISAGLYWKTSISVLRPAEGRPECRL
jgi:hypothetical protein